MGQNRTLLAMCCTEMSAGALSAQVEAFQTVNPVCFLVVNKPAFPLQLDMNTRTPIPYPGFHDLQNTQGYRPIVTPALPVADSSALHQQPTSTAHADTTGFLQEMHRLALLSRPQNFCFSTSCSISLSRLRSATSFFSCWFSSSGCRRRRSSVTPRPASFFFRL
ncbi:hypothetical protein PAJ_0396 [Pantoea ananatis AJ13355]|uniref:Uncharacterized protein n=1 Tax=Pantoea ananatis (strain AJ13355) TaxID=932677 RepID=A0A0H3KTK6_PANAA|nr:hypothetical protein PAJ_0396 [Pantoea ananatis AJ13355]